MTPGAITIANERRCGDTAERLTLTLAGVEPDYADRLLTMYLQAIGRGHDCQCGHTTQLPAAVPAPEAGRVCPYLDDEFYDDDLDVNRKLQAVCRAPDTSDACPHLDNAAVRCPVLDACYAIAQVLRTRAPPARQIAPNGRISWTPEEDDAIRYAQTVRDAWASYLARFPGNARTRNGVKRRWYTLRCEMPPAPEVVLDIDEVDPDQMVICEEVPVEVAPEEPVAEIPEPVVPIEAAPPEEPAATPKRRGGYKYSDEQSAFMREHADRLTVWEAFSRRWPGVGDKKKIESMWYFHHKKGAAPVVQPAPEPSPLPDLTGDLVPDEFPLDVPDEESTYEPTVTTIPNDEPDLRPWIGKAVRIVDPPDYHGLKGLGRVIKQAEGDLLVRFADQSTCWFQPADLVEVQA